MPEISEIYQLNRHIDTFASGYSGRVLSAKRIADNAPIAFKVLRAENIISGLRLTWEYESFGNEAHALQRLAHSPNVVELFDCGYIKSTDEIPRDGEIKTFGTDADEFMKEIDQHAYDGWRPYLALPYLPRTQCLYYLIKPDAEEPRRRLPSEEGIALAIQFANVLRTAHHHDLVYLDHRLEHLYWDGKTLTVIDFNNVKQLYGDASDRKLCVEDIQKFCIGVLYPIFTGTLIDASVYEAERSVSLDFSCEPSLGRELRDLIQRGANSEYQSIDEFLVMLTEVAALHGWDFPSIYTSPASRSVRGQMRSGLRKIREAQTLLRDARDDFREALVEEDITEELEDELRRLTKTTNDMLNHRVIP